MVLEMAEFYIQVGQEADFIAAVGQGQALFMSSEGYIRHSLQQSIEDPTRFVLLIEWDSVEAHNVGFRESDRFPQWRALISPHFAKPPFVQHFNQVI
jgi:heme-degrading monooxygenase HmoA